MVTAPTGPRTRGFNCSNCGGAVELRALAHTRSVTCTTCGAILDPRDPNVVILQEAARRERITPTIPLGTRGTWHGQPYEVIGFQRRSITVDGDRYSWDEYVLFNPYRGFRYLSEYLGHWNDIRTIRAIPRVVGLGRPEATYDGRTYKHFQRATATTDFVIGEFPWRVTVGDAVETNDYVDPPYMLSSETTGQETTWSHGTYTPAAQIWSAFGLSSTPSEPIGIFANQPNPHARRGPSGCTVFLVLSALLFLLFVTRMMTADREVVFRQGYTYSKAPGSEAAFVTPAFRLRDEGTISIDVAADVSNNWLGLDIALINLETGTAYNADAEVSFYAGVEGGETWTEGSRSANVFLPSVPAGEYYLRVEPEGGGAATRYNLTVTRDVPSKLPYLFALGALLLIPFLFSDRAAAFERQRLEEGDYGSGGSSSDDEDDEE